MHDPGFGAPAAHLCGPCRECLEPAFLPPARKPLLSYPQPPAPGAIPARRPIPESHSP